MEWEVVKLKDHIEQIRGVTYKGSDSRKEEFKNSIAILRSNNIGEGVINYDNLVFVNKTYAKDFQRLQLNDILITASTGSKKVIGKNGAISNEIESSFGAFCKVVRPLETVNPSYLKHFFQTKRYRTTIRNVINGANINNIRTRDIDNLKIPLPPLPIQKKIAAILDAADDYRQKTKALLDKYDELTQSIFLDMFGDPVRNEKGWEVRGLEEVSTIGSGITKGRKLKSDMSLQLPYMRVANVQDGYLSLDEIKLIPGSEADLIKYGLEVGDVLLTEGGDPDKLGRGAIWNGEIPNCVHQNHIFKVRLNHQYLLSEYFSKLCGSIYGKRYFLKRAKQTTGIATINKTQLKAFPCYIPPLEVQTEFVSMILEINTQIDFLKNGVHKSEQLFQSLLQRAFKGELVN